ncbi:hypothetical protein BDQ17DRAFT_1235777 [Cyathus striatus]|nr:hypothetical protein BDQ17DRAFT_1235777 [Cyathus striatus]
MHLYLSSSDQLNSSYSTDEGHTIYRVKTPLKVIHLTSTIERAIPNIQQNSVGPETFGFLAEVGFHDITPSRIRYRGQESSVNDFFGKKLDWTGFGSYHVFTGPDGKEYYWKLGTTAEVLFLNDDSKTPVAHFHHKHYGIFRKKRPASLEIFPAGEHMMDLILVTFIYIEKLRVDLQLIVNRGPY